MAQTPFSMQPEPAPGISRRVLLIATGAVLLLVAVIAWTTLHRTPPNANAELPMDVYAANLRIENIELSEATNGTGGKVNYIDGKLTNAGPKTLTGATAQLTFESTDGSSPQRQLVPVSLIRTREPYVDLEPIQSEPLLPGASHDFRLIVENVPAAWDEKPPVLRVTSAAVR